MRFTNLFFTLCATMICGGTISALADDNASQAAARAALLQQLQGANGAVTNMPQNPAVTVAPVTPPPAQPAAVAPAQAPVATVNPTGVSGDNASQAAARAALLQKAPEVSGPSVTTTTASPVVMTPAPRTPAAPAAMDYKPIIAPALPISADQQARLQALDAKYQANQIPPLDYFTQREAILNGQ